jgi:hypothetical protein
MGLFEIRGSLCVRLRQNGREPRSSQTQYALNDMSGVWLVLTVTGIDSTRLSFDSTRLGELPAKLFPGDVELSNLKALTFKPLMPSMSPATASPADPVIATTKPSTTRKRVMNLSLNRTVVI